MGDFLNFRAGMAREKRAEELMLSGESGFGRNELRHNARCHLISNRRSEDLDDLMPGTDDKRLIPLDTVH
jgi:hypothetical protein